MHSILPARVGDGMWRLWYQRLAKAKAWGELNYMNYGFTDALQPLLDEKDESDRLFIQLYHMNIRDIELEGKHVLEVGSGRGGGADWIARTYSPSTLTALDYSAKAVQLCKRLYSEQGNLDFVKGNAMALPFDDTSFDVIYNVESSHCYSDMAAFVAEVHRLLRPGGLFAWTDFREESRMAEVHEIFLDSGFGIVKHSEVTAEVLKALDEVSDDKQARIKNGTSLAIRRSFETFAGVRGTPVYESFQNGSLGYHRYLLTK